MFGITAEDIAMQAKISEHGLTVAEAMQLDKEDKLPSDLKEALNEYKVWLDNYSNGGT